MLTKTIKEELNSMEYHGRGILIGKSQCGKKAVVAYFIMGRSENSRNRVFVEEGEGIRTQAFDPSKMTDPHLIIYAPVRVMGNKTIVTNGDQTDTIYDLMDKQQTFEQSLRTREFEDDTPNYTPRISGMVNLPCPYSKARTGTVPPVSGTPLRTAIPLRARANLSTPTAAGEILSPASRANRKMLRFPVCLSTT